MSDLRTAAQQALEALETLVPTKGPSIYNSARDALRAALAQQAEPVEPVAWLAPDGSVRETPAAKSFGEWVWGPDDFKPLYTAPPQRKPLTSDKDRPDQGTTYVEGYGYVDTRAVRAIEKAHGIGEQP